ncbi:hypothetical protein KZO58_02620 [Prevotella histicola]|uniref:hypothetical protein n=2 Tax=Prevotella histicola TaxID=470565 RepID=UPI001C606891|nr:hypothetical protein [Prevotella histicola]MBW4738420.1 hypothetical protein [Prevotella histicola]MBW4746928.1 hypothetical protein [Prevotella histicola]
MIKFLKVSLILLCNTFLLSSCMREVEGYDTFATITLNGEVYKNYDSWNWLRSSYNPVFLSILGCEEQLTELDLYLRKQPDNRSNHAYSLYIVFDSPLKKLKLKEPYTIVSTEDTLLYKNKRLDFYKKIWEDRRHLPTFGSGGVCILRTMTGDSRTEVFTSLSGTCVLNDYDKKGFAHGYLKLSGIWPTGERCYLEGDFTAHAGGPEDIEQK